MLTQPLVTVGELIAFLKNYNPEAQVMIDLNHLTGGSYVNLRTHNATESPLDNPRIVELGLTAH